MAIMPAESYSVALNILDIPLVKDHHEHLCEKFFQSAVSANNRIHTLLSDRNELSYNLISVKKMLRSFAVHFMNLISK